MSLSDLILVVFLKFTSWVFAANCCALGYPPSPGCAWVKRGGGSHKGTPLCFGAAQTQLTERDTKKKMMMMLSLTLFVPRRVGKYNKKGHPIFRDSNAKIFVAKNNVGTDFVILQFYRLGRGEVKNLCQGAKIMSGSSMSSLGSGGRLLLPSRSPQDPTNYSDLFSSFLATLLTSQTA